MRQFFLSITKLLMFCALLSACSASTTAGAGAASTEPTPFDTSKTVSIGTLNTITAAPSPHIDDSDSNISLSDMANTSLTLQGLAVAITSQSTYKRKNTDTAWRDDENLNINTNIALSRITSPAITLAFGANGDISEVTAYANEAYKTGDADVTIDSDRSTIFGFTSDYMAYISWDLPEDRNALTDENNSTTEISGAMLAGIQSDVADFPNTQNKVTFNGKGKGVYGVSDANNQHIHYNTSFTATAIADFTAYVLTLTTDTICATCIDIDVSTLNFNLTGDSALGFADGNNIRDDVTLGDLSGMLDARFYGGEAWEFGGTFALVEANKRYYYGAFGAKRDGIVAPLNFNKHKSSISLPKGWDEDIAHFRTSDQSISQASDNEGDVTMDALLVYSTDRTDYTRSPNRAWNKKDADIQQTITLTNLLGSAASIVFNADGNISEIEIYFDGANHKIDNFTSATKLSASSNEANNDNLNGPLFDADTTTLYIERGEDFFGFDADYMVYASATAKRALKSTNTGFTEYRYDYDSIMLAGIQTTDDALLSTAGKGSFSGKGRGIYGILDTNNDIKKYTTIFNVIAHVNFDASNVALNIDDTVCISDDCANDNITASSLNFDLMSDLALSFADANKISKEIKIDSDSLIGRIDARFYGTNNDAAHEFGGTFSLVENNKRYYYGAFGAENYITVTTTHIDTPTTFNDNGLTGFNDANRLGTSNNVVKATVVQITKTNDNVITTNKITDAVFEFDYKANGHFNDKGLTLYFADKKYKTLGGYGDEEYTQSRDVENDMADAVKNVVFARDSYSFSFAPNHMVRILWSVQEDDYKTDGVGIAGFETMADNIPKTGNATFKGNGRGQHYSVRNNGLNSVTSFKVTVQANFSDKKVTLMGEELRVVDDVGDALDFTGTLSYQTKTNAFTGAIETAGDADNGIEKLTGTADAKFYGTGTDAAKEFGGTFSMSNDEAAYVGWFGAKKK